MFIKNLFKHDSAVLLNDESMLYPIFSADKLLDETRHNLLQQLRSLVTVPDQYYEDLYLTLVQRFIEFVQILPLTDVGPLSEILNDGLQRALITLQVYKENPLKTVDPLLIYAIFSAMLLMDIDSVCQQKKIIISDLTGAAIKEWEPFAGSMLEQGEYFRVRPYRIVYPIEIRLMLAQMLMPQEGFLWIAREDKVFRLWMAILLGQEEEETTRILRNILTKIKEKFAEVKKTGNSNLVTVRPIEPTDTMIGEEFLRWLKAGLQDQSISVNKDDSKVIILHEGALLTHPDLFKDFASASKQSNWVVVQKQFNALGLHKLSGYDKKFEQFFSVTTDYANNKLTKFSGKNAAVNLKTGTLLASEWLYTSPKTAIPAVNTKVALANKDMISSKRVLPSLNKLPNRFVNKAKI